MKSNPNEPSFAFDHLPLHWQMTRCEKYAFNKILEHANPEIALEIGTYKGGSLQVIAKVAQKVFSLDINSKSQDALKPLFKNVDFLSGDSKTLLPTLLARLETERAPLGFALLMAIIPQRESEQISTPCSASNQTGQFLLFFTIVLTPNAVLEF